MAKRKRRKNAGPPPVPVKKSPSGEAVASASRSAAPKRKPGEPIPSSFTGVLVRAGIVAAIFYPYLIYVVGESPGGAFLVSLLAFALMVPLGLLLDRFRYKRQMKRWTERRSRPQAK